MPFVGSMLAVYAKDGGDYFRVDWRSAWGSFGLTHWRSPFVLPFAAYPGKPRRSCRRQANGWHGAIKVTLGFVELAAALKFFSNAEVPLQLGLLPRELFLAMWAAIFLCATLYLLGFIKLSGDNGEIGPGRMVAGLSFMLFTFYFAYGSLGYRLNNTVMLALEPPYSAQRVSASAFSTPADGHTAGGTTPTGGEDQQGNRAPAQHSQSTAPGVVGDRHVIVKDDFDHAVKIAKEKGQAVLINFTGFT